MKNAGRGRTGGTGRRVVVTGTGAVTPLGLDVASFWAGLLEDRSGAGPITRFDASEFTTRFACEVRGFDPLDHMDRKLAGRTDPFVHYALGAANEALQRLDSKRKFPDREGPFVGQAARSQPFEVGLHRVLGAVNDPKVFDTAALNCRLYQAPATSNNERQRLDHHPLSASVGKVGPPVDPGCDAVHIGEIDVLSARGKAHLPPFLYPVV
jgi:hypothetical protein